MEDMAAEDFERLCQTPPAAPEPPEPVWWKISGGTELTPTDMAALQGLIEFREKEARLRDLPSFKILSNNALLSIVLENPRTESALRKIKGIGEANYRRYGKNLFQINKTSRTRKDIPMPVPVQRPSNGILSRRERMKNWRKNSAWKTWKSCMNS